MAVGGSDEARSWWDLGEIGELEVGEPEGVCYILDMDSYLNEPHQGAFELNDLERTQRQSAEITFSALQVRGVQKGSVKTVHIISSLLC